MKNIVLLSCILVFYCFTLKAQTLAYTAQPFGVVDTADLKLAGCDFEKGANSMILFDKATLTSTGKDQCTH